MFLSDRDIIRAVAQKEIGIEPFDPHCVQPASYDMHLGHEFKVFRYEEGVPGVIDLKAPPPPMIKLVAPDNVPFSLGPNKFCLASTIERVKIPKYMIGRLEGKSSLGRVGLTAHITAGFFDPGFEGYPTLELFNATTRTILLYAGMPICQMSFANLLNPAAHGYGAEVGSKYQDQGSSPKESAFHRNWIEVEGRWR